MFQLKELEKLGHKEKGISTYDMCMTLCIIIIRHRCILSLFASSIISPFLLPLLPHLSLFLCCLHHILSLFVASDSMVVKDIVHSLIDDGLVDTDRVGISNYFWSFPSKAVNKVRPHPSTTLVIIVVQMFV